MLAWDPFVKPWKVRRVAGWPLPPTATHLSVMSNEADRLQSVCEWCLRVHWLMRITTNLPSQEAELSSTVIRIQNDRSSVHPIVVLSMFITFYFL